MDEWKIFHVSKVDASHIYCSHSSSSRKTGISSVTLNSVRLSSHWPFNKLKRIFYGYKEGGGEGGVGQGAHHGQRHHHQGAGQDSSSYAQQIAEIQHKQHKSKRHGSVSSDNFSSSRYFNFFFKFSSSR